MAVNGSGSDAVLLSFLVDGCRLDPALTRRRMESIAPLLARADETLGRPLTVAELLTRVSARWVLPPDEKPANRSTGAPTSRHCVDCLYLASGTPGGGCFFPAEGSVPPAGESPEELRDFHGLAYFAVRGLRRRPNPKKTSPDRRGYTEAFLDGLGSLPETDLRRLLCETPVLYARGRRQVLAAFLADRSMSDRSILPFFRFILDKPWLWRLPVHKSGRGTILLGPLTAGHVLRLLPSSGIPPLPGWPETVPYRFRMIDELYKAFPEARALMEAPDLRRGTWRNDEPLCFAMARLRWVPRHAAEFLEPAAMAPSGEGLAHIAAAQVSPGFVVPAAFMDREVLSLKNAGNNGMAGEAQDVFQVLASRMAVFPDRTLWDREASSGPGIRRTAFYWSAVGLAILADAVIRPQGSGFRLSAYRNWSEPELRRAFRESVLVLAAEPDDQARLNAMVEARETEMGHPGQFAQAVLALGVQEQLDALRAGRSMASLGETREMGWM